MIFLFFLYLIGYQSAKQSQFVWKFMKIMASSHLWRRRNSTVKFTWVASES